MSDDLREMLRESIHEAADASGETSPVAPAPSGGDGGVGSHLSQNQLAEADSDTTATVAGNSEPTGTVRDSVAQSARARDASGKFARAEKTATEAPKPAQAAPSVTAPPKPSGTPASSTPIPLAGEPSVALKPPQNWRATAKDHWGKLPPEVQQEAVRIHHETRQAFDENANFRKVHQALQEAIAPFEGHLRATGANPLEAIQGAMRMQYTLERGSPQQKQAAFAQAFRASGLSIDQLAEAIDGQPSQGQPQSQQQPMDVATLKQQVLQEITQTFQAQQAESRNRKAAEEVAAFAANAEAYPHFQQVQEEMRILQLASAQAGRRLSLEDAYNKAVRLDPELSQYEEQRKASVAANAQVASTQRALAAASSVKSQPAADGPTPQSDSVRGLLRETISEAKRRQ
jgi:hypothetical protein